MRTPDGAGAGGSSPAGRPHPSHVDEPHRPFAVLLASRPPSEARGRARSVLVSFVLHATVGTSLVWATMAMSQEVTREEEPVFIELVEEVAPPPPPPPPAVEEQAPPTVEEVFKGFQILEVPEFVPPDIPPPAAHAAFSERDFTGEGVEGGRADGREAPDSVSRVVDPGPAFTPYTVAPRLENRQEIARALEREYPPILRDARIGGTVVLWVHIDEQGQVTDTRVHTSSGHDHLDRAAMAVAREMRFTPALNRDLSVPVWVSLPVTFTVR